MSQIFDLFRISLIERKQVGLFEDGGISRENYIRLAFGRDWQFYHYKIPFHYKPAKLIARENPYMLARIGREVQIVENAPPEKDFEEQYHDGWITSIIVIDPSPTKDGQKLAMQRNQQVGTSYSILRKFVDHINETLELTRYLIEITPIFDAETFWQFAEENKGDVVSITFDFVVPNGVWSTQSTLRDELAQAREMMRAQEVSTTVKSQAGLETDSEQIRECVSYAETGSGKIKAKTRSGRRFDSTRRGKSTTVIEDIAERGLSALGRVAARMAEILGHE